MSGVDATGRSTSAKKRRRRRGRQSREVMPLAKRFVQMPYELLVSAGWRAMPQRARIIVDRLMVEHMIQGGKANGELIVTYENFREFGAPDGRQREAITEAVALGFVRVTEIGRPGSIAEVRRASRYRLTFLPTHDGKPATDEWRALSDGCAAKAALAAAKSKTPGDKRPLRHRGQLSPTGT